jgi:hypothetical protein
MCLRTSCRVAGQVVANGCGTYVREALSRRDAALATTRAEALKRVLQEAGGTLYAQAPQAGPSPHVRPGDGGAQW